MKKTLSIILTVLLVLSVLCFATACHKDEPHTCTSKCEVCGGCKNASCTEDACKTKCTCSQVELKTIEQVLTQNNNTDACIEGVVFAKVYGGYYVADATGSIYVEDAALSAVSATTAGAAIGDKIKVVGKFKLTNRMPSIGNATVTTSSTGNTPKTTSASTVEAISKLDHTANASYFQYVTVSGIVTKDTSGNLIFTDGTNTVKFTAMSNATALEAVSGSKVTLPIVVHGKVDDVWTVSFGGQASDIAKVPVNVAEVKDAAFDYVTGVLATEVYADLELPNGYIPEPDLVLRWTVKEGNAIQILSNVAIVELQSEDATVTLTLTLSSQIDKDNTANKATKDYTVTVKGIRTIAMADFDASQLANNETFYLEGQVIHKARQSGLWSVILGTADSKFVRVDLVGQEQSNALNLGDTAKFLGSYKADKNGIYGFTTMNRDDAMVVTTPAPDGFKVDFSSYTSTTLVTENDWKAVVNNMSGSVVKLFKLSDPYFVLSSTSLSDSKYVRFGMSPTTSRSGVVGNNGAIYNSIDKRDITDNGLGYWLDGKFGIPTTSGVGIKYAGIDMYVFACYYVPGSTNVLQFSTGADMVTVDYETALAEEFAISPFMTATSAGSYNLVTNSKWVGEVVWTCDPAGIVDVTTGAFDVQTENKNITLTASFSINGVPTSYTYNSQLVVGDLTYNTVSQALALADGVIAPMQGTIIAFGTQTTDYTTYATQNGIYITDGTEIMCITAGVGRATDDDYYKQLYTIGEHTLAIGDVLKLVGAKKDGMNLDVSSADITIVSADQVPAGEKVVWGGSYDHLATDKASALTAMTSVQAGQIIKFVATPENPFCLGTSAANKFRMFFKDMGSTLADIKLDGTRIMCTKIENTITNFGGKWWTEMYSDLVAEPEAKDKTNQNYQFVGEFYAVYVATSAKFYTMTWLPDGFTLRPITAEDKAQAEVNNAIATVVTSYTVDEAGTVNLPATAGETALTWTLETVADGFSITENVLSYPAVTTETSVKLKASYMIGAENKSSEITLTFVQGQIVYKSVTEAIAVNDPTASINIEGQIVSIASSATQTGATSQGFYIADGSNIVYVKAGGNIVAKTTDTDHFAFTIGSAETSIGAFVQITGVTVDGKVVTCAETSVASIDTEKSSSTLAFVPTADITITNNAEMVAFTSTLVKNQATDMKIVKFVGTKETPLYLGLPGATMLAFYYDKGTEGWATGTTTNTVYKIKATADAESATEDFKLCFNPSAIAATIGANWVKSNTPVVNTTPGGVTGRTFYTSSGVTGKGGAVSCFNYVGEFYAIYNETSGTYLYYDVLATGFNLKLCADLDFEAIAKTVDASSAGTITLPTAITDDYCQLWKAKTIAWSTTSTGVSIEGGVVSFDAVTTDTVITLTATISPYASTDATKNVVFTRTITITLKAAA